MIRRKKENIQWLEFEQLQEFPEVIHGVFLRPLSLEATREENRRRVRDLLGIGELINKKQVHGNRVELVPESNQFECDGLITQNKDTGLLIKHADCQAALFYDPIHKAIGNIHCGWRGSVENIYKETVEAFRNHFNSRPEDLLVCISPSLGPENAQFINYKTELPESFYEFQVRPCYFDFWEISKMQLETLGVLSHHIEIAKQCTFFGKQDFFSARRDKKTGRNGTVIALKQ